MEERYLEIMKEKKEISSLELVEQINFFRREEGKKTDLQHKDLLKIIRSEFEEEIGEGKISPIYYTDSQNRRQPMFMLSLSQSKQVLLRESKFVRKGIIKFIDSIEEKVLELKQAEKVEVNFQALKHISDLMGYNDNSKAIMSNRLIDSLGLEKSLKIEYTKSIGVLKPLSQLLKENNIELSAIKVNKKLLELGIIEEKTRNSTKGIKKYKSIKISEYGENQVSPSNPKETQPLYYEDKFQELMELVKC